MTFKEKDQVDVYDEFGYKRFTGTLDIQFDENFWWVLDDKKKIVIVEVSRIRKIGDSKNRCVCGVVSTYLDRPNETPRHAYWCDIK